MEFRTLLRPLDSSTFDKFGAGRLLVIFQYFLNFFLDR
ncbi:hypothetical protein TREPR_0654 [Treponema primitia ZAS-2]|uniref:Uncharacterized protein n=1 Tax=Treponema primitia (strain ATCC BAA-887 / DSM 12427 / ZAS-2) TaxID=545694 RepID=F5YK32_TREPZ|nr:hypothetical protein TREPR_0654 [Treponema primitia ZAS-2]